MGIVACGSEPADPPISDDPPPIESSEAPPPESDPTPPAMEEDRPEGSAVETSVDVPAPVVVDGLPEPVRGRPIRLESLETGERTVDGRTVPTVALSNPAARAALDARLEARPRDLTRCRVTLALETFVAVRCPFLDHSFGVSRRDFMNAHYVISPDGEVEPVPVMSLFHGGVSERELSRMLVHDPEDPQRRMVFTEAGLELADIDDQDLVDRIPFRLVAPFLRPDTPLAAALAEHGVTFGAVGTEIQVPPTVPTIWGRPSALLRLWSGLPADLRAHARITMSADSTAGLLFRPGTTASEVEAHAPDSRVDSGYYSPRAAAITFVRSTAPVELRLRPGPRGDIERAYPAGTVLVAADGFVGRRVSGIGPRNWTLVGLPTGDEGWVAGRHLEVTDCVPEPPEGKVDARGIVEWSGGDDTTSLVWFAAPAPNRTPGARGQVLSMHQRRDCAPGPELRRFAAPGGVWELHLVRSEADAGDTLLVLIGTGEGADRRSLEVYGPEGTAPVYSQRVRTFEVHPRRGPSGDREHFPLRVQTEEWTWLRWTGSSLEPVRPE